MPRSGSGCGSPAIPADGALRSRLDWLSRRKKWKDAHVVESQLLWLAAAGGVVIGLFAGVLLARRGGKSDARVRELEEQIARTETEHATYRGQVSQHFVETSRRLQDLTLQYKSVYEHLADGARSLCPEGAVLIAPSLAAALPESASAATESADDAQLDLELDAPGRWATNDREHDLGPLLDEETPPPPAETASAQSAAEEPLSRFR